MKRASWICTISAFLLASTISTASMAGSLCTCEDWDKDGRYGVVLNRDGKKSVLQSNRGDYSECMGILATLEQCQTVPVSEPNASLCTCEDWDKDGRYGVVLNSDGKKSVLKSNRGDYNQCMEVLATLDQCQTAPAPDLNASPCTCEDWDKDGRYGVVFNSDGKKSVLKSNRGDYSQCMAVLATLDQCKPAPAPDLAGSICTCEDWDKDGRFGLVLYQARKERPKVLKSNVGDYYKCNAFKSNLDKCSQAGNLCACEDWDKDGRFGVVLYQGVGAEKPVVLKSNIGDYNECISAKPAFNQCR